MDNELLPALLFIFTSTFSPGPSNIASAAMGVRYGYRYTMRFLIGMSVGFFILMSLCAWASGALLKFFPALAAILRYGGAVYILYLAVGIFKADYTDAQEPAQAATQAMGFTSGLLLQLLNPKLVIYGLTLFSTFLAPLGGGLSHSLLVVSGLALVAYCATSVWTLFGTLIKTHLRQPHTRLVVNGLLALFLVYSALDLADVASWLRG